MAKYYGQGVKTGKVGASVFAVRFGETIERQYQPVVANPSTASQIEARSKLKLLSQLSAVMAPVIAMPRVGAISSRNMFTKENYGTTSYSDNQANIELLNVKLTRGILSLPAIQATRGDSNVTVKLTSPAYYDRIVYCVFIKQADNTLRLEGSFVNSTPGVGNDFQQAMVIPNVPLVIYAYGIRDNNDAARAIFGNMEVVTAETVAKVIVSRTLKETDISLTETVAVSVPAGA